MFRTKSGYFVNIRTWKWLFCECCELKVGIIQEASPGVELRMRGGGADQTQVSGLIHGLDFVFDEKLHLEGFDLTTWLVTWAPHKNEATTAINALSRTLWMDGTAFLRCWCNTATDAWYLLRNYVFKKKFHALAVLDFAC